ncbi:hypothetical protein OpiT1DRAFT_03972 [Opitutaceae bacterium TAV1]|nr:hypothetical protein OpiT1DRAFT_03972 [Opitutaceae bacterium TAV1]
MNTAEIKNIFTYHPPAFGQGHRYDAIRAGGQQLALLISEATPRSGEQVIAIRKVQEAVQMACAAIACNEPDATQVQPAPHTPGDDAITS